MKLDLAPVQSGSYALHLSLAVSLAALQVGRLGSFHFPAGDYYYLGSARGPGGLRARLAHHARLAKIPHWHLDFLRQQACLLGAWVAPVRGPLECAWSQALLDTPGASLPAAGFGSSDCRFGCSAHLVRCSPDQIVPVLQSFTESAAWVAL
jgi:Uri superfamily endonuclease